jgi:type IV pilus biogenesis protein CpaD/CtpE
MIGKVSLLILTLLVAAGCVAPPATVATPTRAVATSAPAVVSENDHDETIGPNKPFKDITQGLASQGIAVLRYDK